MAANAANINISPTHRRSPRNTNVNRDSARTLVIHPRPADALVNNAHKAILDDNMAELRRVISVCKEGWFGSEGVYLLHFAANHGGSSPCIEFLGTLSIAAGFHIDKYNAENRTPLYCACETGNYNAAKQLIQMGAKVETCDMHRNTPLHISAAKNFHRIVELLLDNNADVHALTAGGSTPLHRAAATGALESARLLVGRGALVTALNLQKRTPLYLARNHGGDADEVAAYLRGLVGEEEDEENIRSPRRNSPQSTPSSSPSTPRSSGSSSAHSTPPSSSPSSTPDRSSKRSVEEVAQVKQEKVKKEKKPKRLKVDEEITFRVAPTPYDSPVPSPAANTTTVTSTTQYEPNQPALLPIAPGRAAELANEARMGPPTAPKNIKSPPRSLSPLRVKPEAKDRIVKVKRKQDELFWEVRVPTGCTFKNFETIVKNKIGFSFTTIAKGNVRVADSDDVDRLVNDCELIVY